ncbi:UNC93-like protein isoform X1 [Centruroides sculpturatus]|uniref:UNC93-like protein isoform X1 n=2 Tax=Centruroides sculpturatus TaxID=218467 RepID=UPI000C6EAB81|nr:UNC93-like protein isoform X1 [Centruroides sculpturatus]
MVLPVEKNEIIVNDVEAKGVNKVTKHENEVKMKKDPMNKRKIVINLIVICLSFTLLFTAFQALANLQSTLNNEVGLFSQSVIYAALILSSMFLPTYSIRRLGCKLILVLSIISYAPYIASNFYPIMATMIPSAAILGVGASCLWSAKCTYLNEIGFKYARLVNEKVDVIIVRFFGIFFMFFQTSQIWGNLISWLILEPPAQNVTEDSWIHCGAGFCPNQNQTSANLKRPPENQTNMLIGIYLGCCILSAILMAIFLSPLTREEEEKEAKLSARLLLATFRHLKDCKQLLLIPLTIYSGIEQTFFLGEYTKAYIACSLGVYRIGLVAICFGVVNALVSLASGPLVKLIGRMAIFLIATAANLATVISLLYWKPKPDAIVIYFVIAGVWGLADAVWQTQINAFYGILFKNNEEAAFSNYRMWESIGFSIAFAYSSYLCVELKIYILLGFLIVGIIGYLIIEMKFTSLKLLSSHNSYDLTDK